MREYVNNNPFTVFLTSPDGTEIRLKSRQRKMLSEYYERFVSRGFISRVDEAAPPLPQQHIRRHNLTQLPISRANRANKPTLDIRKPKPEPARHIKTKIINSKSHNTVGRQERTDGDKIFSSSGPYSISNNIGVGILSYNREGSLRQLISAIKKYTDLSDTTVFVSDDGSTNSELLSYLDTLVNDRIVVLKNKERLGIAGNTNRLIQCLSRFKYAIILNDDVQIKDYGWEYFYPKAMDNTGFVHFIHREPGVYGVEKGVQVNVIGATLLKAEDKPQGAILAYRTDIVDRIGYFDESYGIYGMEHIDWSTKVFENSLQPVGFYDVSGSDLFFKLPNTNSAVENRVEHLRKAKILFDNRDGKKVKHSDKSYVKPVSYVIPCRNFERSEAIDTIILSIKAQKYPCIDIVVSEQDSHTKLSGKSLPYKHVMAASNRNHLFNKSLAFNRGVDASSSDLLILHDADIMVADNYTTDIVELLQSNNACHLGKTVIYTNEHSSSLVNNSGIVGSYPRIERVVGYFEGGSLACRKDYYWEIGGFNEDFWGYGVEDCEFYARLKSRGFKEDRKHVFLHLYHSRFPGWDEHHNTNKRLGDEIYKLSMEERIKRQRAQAKSKGYL